MIYNIDSLRHGQRIPSIVRTTRSSPKTAARSSPTFNARRPCRLDVYISVRREVFVKYESSQERKLKVILSEMLEGKKTRDLKKDQVVLILKEKDFCRGERCCSIE